MSNILIIYVEISSILLASEREKYINVIADYTFSVSSFKFVAHFFNLIAINLHGFFKLLPFKKSL